MEKLFWTAYTHEERNKAISQIQILIANYGDITDFKFFSDISLSITIEISEHKIDELYDELKNIVGIDKHEKLNSNSNREREIFLNITFTAGTGNLLVEVPAVPG